LWVIEGILSKNAQKNILKALVENALSSQHPLLIYQDKKFKKITAKSSFIPSSLKFLSWEEESNQVKENV
jgi:hypothetical protein